MRINIILLFFLLYCSLVNPVQCASFIRSSEVVVDQLFSDSAFKPHHCKDLKELQRVCNGCEKLLSRVVTEPFVGRLLLEATKIGNHTLMRLILNDLKHKPFPLFLGTLCPWGDIEKYLQNCANTALCNFDQKTFEVIVRSNVGINLTHYVAGSLESLFARGSLKQKALDFVRFALQLLRDINPWFSFMMLLLESGINYVSISSEDYSPHYKQVIIAVLNFDKEHHMLTDENLNDIFARIKSWPFNKGKTEPKLDEISVLFQQHARLRHGDASRASAHDKDKKAASTIDKVLEVLTLAES